MTESMQKSSNPVAAAGQVTLIAWAIGLMIGLMAPPASADAPEVEFGKKGALVSVETKDKTWAFVFDGSGRPPARLFPKELRAGEARSWQYKLDWKIIRKFGGATRQEGPRRQRPAPSPQNGAMPTAPPIPGGPRASSVDAGKIAPSRVGDPRPASRPPRKSSAPAKAKARPGRVRAPGAASSGGARRHRSTAAPRR